MKHCTETHLIRIKVLEENEGFQAYFRKTLCLISSIKIPLMSPFLLSLIMESWFHSSRILKEEMAIMVKGKTLSSTWWNQLSQWMEIDIMNQLLEDEGLHQLFQKWILKRCLIKVLTRKSIQASKRTTRFFKFQKCLNQDLSLPLFLHGEALTDQWVLQSYQIGLMIEKEVLFLSQLK